MVREKLTLDPRVAVVITDPLQGCPIDTILSNEAVYGKISRASMLDPMRNTEWQYLFFNDSSVFSPASNAFKKSREDNSGTGVEPSYTSAIPGTIEYKEFWTKERDRCLQGYEPYIDGKPCGVRIPGEYYFYLNYCLIELVAINKDTGEEIGEPDFPIFCTMDYYWFKELEKRENPKNREDKKSLIVVKARRKGFSFKNAGGAMCKVIIAAELGVKAKDTFDMAMDMLDFLNQYTEFGGPTVNRVSTKDHCYVKAGKEVEENGKKYVKGRKSVITTVTLHNNPKAAVGNGTSRVLFEEAGLITQLKQAWGYTEPTLRSGKIYKGIAIIFGTGGDMKGDSQDFSEMFYNPEAYHLASFDNIYEETEVHSKCGYFVDEMWFREGDEMIDGQKVSLLDTNGNAIRWAAEVSLNREREASKNKDRASLALDLTQYCKTPSEAFLIVGGNIFASILPELIARLGKLKSDRAYRLLGTKGTLVEQKGLVDFLPDLEGKLQPIDTYPIKPNQKNREGCLVIYEQPREIRGQIPSGAYIISMDTIGIEESGAESLICIMVLKTKKYMYEIGFDDLVAIYVGRAKEDPTTFANFIAFKLSKYYNAKVDFENDRNGAVVQEFFIKNNALSRLMDSPNRTMEKHITNSATSKRVKGHSMGSPKHVEMGEIYLKRWLMQSRGINPDNGLEERNLDLIPDIGLLQELVSYNRTGNFDRIRTLMGCVIQQEEVYNQYASEEDPGKETVMDQFARKFNEYYGGDDESHASYVYNKNKSRYDSLT